MLRPPANRTVLVGVELAPALRSASIAPKAVGAADRSNSQHSHWQTVSTAVLLRRVPRRPAEAGGVARRASCPYAVSTMRLETAPRRVASRRAAWCSLSRKLPACE
jgi:hypothetical protein